MTDPTERRDERFVRLNDAGVALGVSSKQVKKYCACGILECQRTPGGHWRVLRTSLDDAVAKMKSTQSP